MSGQGGELAAALAFYKRQTEAGNRAFFQGKIDALYKKAELSDKQRLAKLAPYFALGSWPSSGHGSSITSPRELLTPAGEPGYVDLGINNDGTIPPQTEQLQAEYLNTLHSLLGEVSGDRVEDPAEFAQLLTMTDAISDMDFAQSGSPGLNGTCAPLTRNDMSDRQPEQREWYDDGWSVVSGWRCAYGNPVGATLMLYAQKETGTYEERELKWRVYTWDERDFVGGMWFSSISQYLRYRCQWYQRLPVGWQDQWLGAPSDSEEWEEEEDEEDEEDEDEEQEDD